MKARSIQSVGILAFTLRRKMCAHFLTYARSTESSSTASSNPITVSCVVDAGKRGRPHPFWSRPPIGRNQTCRSLGKRGWEVTLPPSHPPTLFGNSSTYTSRTSHIKVVDDSPFWRLGQDGPSQKNDAWGPRVAERITKMC